jgi:hypothetical protein
MTLAISSPTVLVLRLYGGGAVLGVTVPDTAGTPATRARPMTSHPATHVEQRRAGP